MKKEKKKLIRYAFWKEKAVSEFNTNAISDA